MTGRLRALVTVATGLALMGGGALGDSRILWVGGVTDRLANFRVECCLDALVADTFILYRNSANPDAAGSMVLEIPVSKGITAIDSAPLPNRLQPDTTYYYALRATLASDPAYFGTFKTMPLAGQAANFSFAFASCATSGSNHEVFEDIAAVNPLFFLHMGDLFYADISENDVEKYKAAYVETWGSETQSKLYRSQAVVYMWDDHDFGPNDSNGESASKAAAREAYRMFVPHHELAMNDGANIDSAIHHAFTVGRVRFIVLDLRSESEDPTDAATWRHHGTYPSMLGRRQKEWLVEELQGHSQWGMMVMVSTKPWSGTDSEAGCCKWMNYAVEREEIANMIAAAGVTNLIAVAGDAHMLAYDDGSNTDYSSGAGSAGFPLFHSAPLDKEGSFKGGPFSEGCHTKDWTIPNQVLKFVSLDLIKPTAHQFSTLSVDDQGDSVCITAQGYEHAADGAAQKIASKELRLCTPFVRDGAPGAGECAQEADSDSARTIAMGITALILLLILGAIGICVWSCCRKRAAAANGGAKEETGEHEGIAPSAARQ